MCTIMFVTLILFATLGTTFAGYAGSSSNDVGGGNSYGYGYSGSFSGNGGDIPNIPSPNFPNIPNFDFGSLLNGYFDSFKKYHEHFINTRRPFAFAITSSSPNANVQAQSSITFVNNNRLQQQAQLAQQQAELASRNGGGYASGFTSYGAPGSASGGGGAYSGGVGGGYPAGDGGAVASASIGPKGGYQTAAVYPENPNSPNIFSRFAETSQPGEGGSYSVFTSSVSSSSNQDGKPKNFHQASTTINDNGKVSTYTVKNP